MVLVFWVRFAQILASTLSVCYPLPVVALLVFDISQDIVGYFVSILFGVSFGHCSNPGGGRACNKRVQEIKDQTTVFLQMFHLPICRTESMASNPSCAHPT